MKKLSISWSIKKIMQNINKGNIIFNHPIQRKTGQWTKEQKSLLIHSMLSDYPIPPLYAIKDKMKDNKYSILDGKQRLTIIKDFMEDKFNLLNVPPVIIDDIEFDINGLKFSGLQEELKDELKDVNLLIYIFEDCSEYEIEEIFFRLNNGTALTKDQKTKAKLGAELAMYIDDILNYDLFINKASFSAYQIKRAEDQGCILQTLMLLNEYTTSKYGSNEILKFAVYFRYNHTQSQLDRCKDLFSKLGNAFDKKHKLIKKVNIPMFIMSLKFSEDMEIPFEEFKDWINSFVNKYDTNSEYAYYCGNHTTNKDSVNKRIDLICEDLLEYISKNK